MIKRGWVTALSDCGQLELTHAVRGIMWQTRYSLGGVGGRASVLCEYTALYRRWGRYVSSDTVTVMTQLWAVELNPAAAGRSGQATLRRHTRLARTKAAVSEHARNARTYGALKRILYYIRYILLLYGWPAAQIWSTDDRQYTLLEYGIQGVSAPLHNSAVIILIFRNYYPLEYTDSTVKYYSTNVCRQLKSRWQRYWQAQCRHSVYNINNVIRLTLRAVYVCVHIIILFSIRAPPRTWCVLLFKWYLILYKWNIVFQ